MPFKFVHLCDLLQRLEDLWTRDPPLLPTTIQSHAERAIEHWFRSHRRRIDAADTSGVAVLSAFLPERRTDRVYGLREKSLAKVVGRVLGLPVARRRCLLAWETPGHGDLGACVERVQRQAEMAIPASGHEVTVEEIDRALADLAARCHFSSVAVRARVQTDPVERILSPLFLRLQSREAKWLTRMLLKAYQPVVISEPLVLRLYHFLLPDVLKVHDHIEVAVPLLRGPVLGGMPPQPATAQERYQCRQDASRALIPQIGVKVGRPMFCKARSVKHCLQMVAGRQFSMERKYDGEYCQVHVDLSRPSWIQIFSKSGKDSTTDRKNVHASIRECLRLDRPHRRFRQRCILEGELVVFDDQCNETVAFCKLRKHVSRSGRFLGTMNDSLPHAHEHLMVVFFDLLLLDDVSTLAQPYSERVQRLEDLVQPIAGRASLASRERLDGASRSAKSTLTNAFAQAITQRWEGYVLKPCDQPYLTFTADREDRRCFWIKLKKDYISGLGDTADMAVVGAGFDAHVPHAQDIRGLKWTHFHLGCLQNKADVIRHGAKPRFLVIDTINHAISTSDLTRLNQQGAFRAVDFDPNQVYDACDLVVEPDLPCPMTVLFREPFVFDVMGSGFDKLPNRPYYTLRFPRIVKIHWDRSFRDTVDFAELQALAEQARMAPESNESQEHQEWVERLALADLGKAGAEAAVRDSSYQRTRRSRRGSDRSATSSRSSRQSSVALTGQEHVDPSAPVGSGAREDPHSGPSSVIGSAPVASLKRRRLVVDELISKKRALDPLRDVTDFPPQRRQPPAPGVHPIAPATHAPLAPAASGAIVKQGLVSILPTPPEDGPAIVDKATRSGPGPRPKAHGTGESAAEKSPPADCGRSVTTVTFSACQRCHAAQACSLANTIAYLSPCIAQTPYITEDLLPSHGVPFTLDADLLQAQWLNPRTRRIVLVESHRPTQTIALRSHLRQIGLAGTEVNLYDWRLLECLAKVERGRVLGYDPWERCWSGSV
ncbi:MAG: hypothetical protein M1838_002119 [Thelocarpon superellum]|nr:MAG: hypothetical protein M1838_002119 [Thelocarpon superellum]